MSNFNKLRMPAVLSAALVMSVGIAACSSSEKDAAPRSSHSASAPARGAMPTGASGTEKPRCINAGVVEFNKSQVRRLTGREGLKAERAAWKEAGQEVETEIAQTRSKQPGGEFVVSDETHQFSGESLKAATSLAVELDNLTSANLKMPVGGFASFVDPTQYTAGNWAARLWLAEYVDYDYKEPGAPVASDSPAFNNPAGPECPTW